MRFSKNGMGNWDGDIKKIVCFLLMLMQSFIFPNQYLNLMIFGPD
jgi:hypothetical protein